MVFLINPPLAHFFTVVGITLLMLAHLNATSTLLKAGTLICLAAAGIEFLFLNVNPWAFLVLALSPLPFFLAVRQGHAENPLFLLSILMLVIGSVFLFVDQNNQTAVVSGPAGFVATLCGTVIWIASQRLRNVEGARIGHDPDSVVGLTGETQTDIEPFSAGSVLVAGEIWQARSKKPIPAGSTVRILRQDGFWLTVKKIEKSAA